VLPDVAAPSCDAPSPASDSTNLDENDDPPLASTSRGNPPVVAQKGQEKGKVPFE
jgi:hypothetical protein